MRQILLSAALLFTTAAMAGPEADHTVFRLDPGASEVAFEVRKLGFMNERGKFSEFIAEIVADGENIEAVSIVSVINIASLEVDGEEMRRRLLGPDWFNVYDHPEAVFASEHIELTSPETGIATGTLTLRGVTRPATFNVRFEQPIETALADGETLGFTAEGSFSRSEFGMTKMSGLVGDEVAMDFTGRFVRADEAILVLTESPG